MVNVLTSVEAACGSAGTCVDHDGGFTCQCTDGYEESGAYPYTTCANIEGAILLLPFLLLVAIICVDNEGAFSCECNEGYEESGLYPDTICTNIDECNDGDPNTENCGADH